MSVISGMGAVLDDELQKRGVFIIGRRDCDRIIEAVVERTAAAAAIGARAADRLACRGCKPQPLHFSSSSHPAHEPPFGQALDGGRAIPGDASAVAFSSSAMPAPRTFDGGRASSNDAPAVTPAQKAYALLWREMRVSDRPFAREARTILLASLTTAQQSAAIAWVKRLHPTSDSEVHGS